MGRVIGQWGTGTDGQCLLHYFKCGRYSSIYLYPGFHDCGREARREGEEGMTATLNKVCIPVKLHNVI